MDRPLLLPQHKSVVSPISTNSIPSPLEVPSSDSLATIRDRYQATGLSKEVVDSLLASWRLAILKRYSGPWRIIRGLTAYVKRTKGLRKSTQLLVSFISHHEAILSQSVSRWLSRVLRMAGIELNYTGHSTRGASTSAAAATGLSADLILETEDWASVQTFERFYHRVICWCLRKG